MLSWLFCEKATMVSASLLAIVLPLNFNARLNWCFYFSSQNLMMAMNGVINLHFLTILTNTVQETISFGKKLALYLNQFNVLIVRDY